jgi:hypothetical protein
MTLRSPAVIAGPSEVDGAPDTLKSRLPDPSVIAIVRARAAGRLRGREPSTCRSGL